VNHVPQKPGKKRDLDFREKKGPFVKRKHLLHERETGLVNETKKKK